MYSFKICLYYSKVKRSACKAFTRKNKRLNLPAWLTLVVTQLLHTSHVAQFVDNQYFIEDPYNTFILVKSSLSMNTFPFAQQM